MSSGLDGALCGAEVDGAGAGSDAGCICRRTELMSFPTAHTMGKRPPSASVANKPAVDPPLIYWNTESRIDFYSDHQWLNTTFLLRKYGRSLLIPARCRTNMVPSC